MQGKLFQRFTHFLYCSVLSLDGKVNTRRMSQPDMESIFTKKNLWIIRVIGNYYVNYQNYKNWMLIFSSDTKLMHLFLFTKSPRENWFQYVRRVYVTAINFPSISTLTYSLWGYIWNSVLQHGLHGQQEMSNCWNRFRRYCRRVLTRWIVTLGSLL